MTLKLVAKAHCPAVGVKVYVPVALLLIVAGFQVPVTEFVDVVGKIGLVEPEQIGAMSVKVGIVF